MKRLWYILLVFIIAGQAGGADNKPPEEANEPALSKWEAAISDPNDPNEMLRVKWGATVNVLKAQELDTKAKADIIDKIVSPIFDFPLMSKLALGRTNWPRLNAAQREKFTRLFVERLKASYRDKIMQYKDEKATFKPAVQHKDTIHIPMTLISDGQTSEILYKLHKAKEGWKVYDVEIQGVSILLTYRSQFDDTLSRGTVDDVIRQLEKAADS